MKVVWNTCKKELGGMKSVNAMETTTKSSFENLQSIQKTVYSLWLYYISFSSTICYEIKS